MQKKNFATLMAGATVLLFAGCTTASVTETPTDDAMMEASSSSVDAMMEQSSSSADAMDGMEQEDGMTSSDAMEPTDSMDSSEAMQEAEINVQLQ